MHLSEETISTWIFGNFHVDIWESPREEKLFSTWMSNETSEESFRPYVENKKYPRGELRIPTWIYMSIVS